MFNVLYSFIIDVRETYLIYYYLQKLYKKIVCLILLCTGYICFGKVFHHLKSKFRQKIN